MTDNAPFAQYQTQVQSDWVDYNGHMNVAYYVLAFDHGTDAFHEFLGVGPSYAERENKSMFVVGMNVDYQQEVMEGDPLHITTQLLDWDHKRLHFFHQMFHGDSGERVATNEALAMHVDLAQRRSAPFDKATQARVAEIFQAHHKLGTPEGAYRQLGIRRK